MAQLLADSSVWIDYFNGIRNKESDWLDQSIERDDLIAICPVILQEVLQGIRDDKNFEIVKNELLSLEMLQWDLVSASLAAANLFRLLRKKGVTIRTGVDCLISCYAMEFNIPLLQKDRDFRTIARYTALKLLEP